MIAFMQRATMMMFVATVVGCSGSPSEPTPTVPAQPADDPEVNRLLDDFEAELPVYERAIEEYKKEGLAKLGEVGASQGKLLPLVQSIRERASRFSPSQAQRFGQMNARLQAAAERMAPPKQAPGKVP